LFLQYHSKTTGVQKTGLWHIGRQGELKN